MTSTPDRPQTHPQVDALAQIRSVSLHGPFYMANGAVSPTVLRALNGWKLRLEEPFLVAEHRGETHLVPIENVAGINVAPTSSVQAPHSDDGAPTIATVQPAPAGRRRAGARNR